MLKTTVPQKLMFKKRLPNNAYFLNFVRYDSQKDKMKKDKKYKVYKNASAIKSRKRKELNKIEKKLPDIKYMNLQNIKYLNFQNI